MAKVVLWLQHYLVVTILCILVSETFLQTPPTWKACGFALSPHKSCLTAAGTALNKSFKLPANFTDDKERAQYVKHLVQRKCFDQVEAFLGVHHHEDQAIVAPFVFTSAIFAMSKLPEARHRVFPLFQKMEQLGLQPNVFLFSSLYQAIPYGEDALAKVSELRIHFTKAYPTVQWTLPVYEAAIMACGRCDESSKGKAWQMVEKIRTWMEQENIQTSYRIYLALLKVCSSIQNEKGALSLLEEMRSKHGSSIRMDDRMWTGILRVLARTGNHREALETLYEMSNEFDTSPNVKHATLYLKSLLKSRKATDAMVFLQHMARIQSDEDLVNLELPIPDELAVTTTFSILAAAEDFLLAHRLLDQVKQGLFGGAVQVNEQMYNYVLASCNDPIQATKLIREMRLTRRRRVGVVPPSLMSYTNAVVACRKSGDLKAALFLLKNTGHDGIIPDTYLYSAVIWTAAQVGECDTAYALLEEMKQKGCEPTIVTYNGLLVALVSANRVEEALIVFEELKKDGFDGTYATFFELSKGVKTISKTEDKLAALESIYELSSSRERTAKLSGCIVSALINTYGSLGQYREARAVFDSINGPSDAACLRAILFACGNASPPEWEEALFILHTSDIVGDTIGPTHMDAIAVSNTMLACSKADKWEESLHILQLYGSDRTSVAAFNSLIGACGRSFRPDIAIQVLNDMDDFRVKPDLLSYRNAIIACNHAQHAQSRATDEQSSFDWWECALSLLRRMKENGNQPDVQSFSSVISSLEAAGQWQRALGLLQSLLDEEDNDAMLNVYCFNAAISACEKGGAWLEALELFERMKSHPDKRIRPNEVTIGGLVLALDKAGQEEMSEAIYLEGLRRKTLNPWRTTFDLKGNRFRAMDLHHYSSALARTAVRVHIKNLLESSDTPNDDLVVVVGKGIRSADQPVLHKVVSDLLENDYGITATEDPENAGRLLVGKDDLLDCYRSRSWH